jgi:hypothetical protein
VIRPEDFRAVLQNLAAWIVTVLLTIVGFMFWPNLGHGSVHTTTLKWTAAQAIASGTLFLIVFLIGTLVMLRRFARVRTFTGREEVMRRNGEFVRSLCTADVDDFLSTRVSYWDLAETSPARAAFRKLITDKIQDGHMVKRLWHLGSADDLKRLRAYLKQYASRDNYHVRVVTHITVPIPELICVGRKGASITVPDMRSPRAHAVCMQFRRRAEVSAVRRYFDVLWESAHPVKTGPTIDHGFLSQFELLERPSKSIPESV